MGSAISTAASSAACPQAASTLAQAQHFCWLKKALRRAFLSALFSSDPLPNAVLPALKPVSAAMKQEALLYAVDDIALVQVAQRDCGVSFLEDLQKLFGHCPGQPLFAVPA